MILFSITLPGWFADWCDAVLCRLAEQLGGPMVYAAWPPAHQMFQYEPLGSTLDQLGRALIVNDAEHIVFGARYPDHRLHAALAESKAQFVLAIDDPGEMAAGILSQPGQDARAVIRGIANSCALLDRYRELPGALLLDASRARTDPAGLVEDIALHFDIPLPPSSVSAIVGTLEGLDLTARQAEDRVLAGGAAIERAVSGALQGYRSHFRGGRLDEIVWTRDLFVTLNGQAPTEPVDASGAGGHRIIIFGPYIHLLPGSWNARVRLGFSEETVGAIFMVDAYCLDRQLAAVSFQPTAPGPFTAELNFSLSTIIGQGVEIRVSVVSENAKGVLAFGQAILTPTSLQCGEVRNQAVGDFRAVLEF